MINMYFSKLLPFFAKSPESMVILDNGSIYERFINLYEAVIRPHYYCAQTFLDHANDKCSYFSLINLFVFPLLPMVLDAEPITSYLDDIIYDLDLDISMGVTDIYAVHVYSLNLLLNTFFRLLFVLLVVATCSLNAAMLLVRTILGVIISIFLYPFLCLNNYNKEYKKLWFQLRELGIVKFSLPDLQSQPISNMGEFYFFEELCTILIHSVDGTVKYHFKNNTVHRLMISIEESRIGPFNLLKVEKNMKLLRDSFTKELNVLMQKNMVLDVHKYRGYGLYSYLRDHHINNEFINFINFLSESDDDLIQTMGVFFAKVIDYAHHKREATVDKNSTVTKSNITSYFMSLPISKFQELCDSGYLNNPEPLFDTISTHIDNHPNTAFIDALKNCRLNIQQLLELDESKNQIPICK